MEDIYVIYTKGVYEVDFDSDRTIRVSDCSVRVFD